MKKVLSLVLSLVLVLGMMPVFAVEDMGSAGENLKHYEFITGGTGGDLMEDKEFTREQLAKILAELNGKAEEAAAFEGTVNFKDADEIGAWALPYVAYAVEQDWLVGNDKNEFMPKGIVSGKELLTAMLRVLGYETEWATVVEEAAEVGFTASEGELTRGQAFETLWTVVSEIPAKGSDVALGVELGKLEPETPVVTDLDFTLAGTNLKEIMVEFNQEVEKESVKDANFVVKLGTTTKKATATVKDGNMVVLTMEDALTNQKTYSVTVEKVKPVNGTEIAKTTKDVTVFDRELPEVVEVKVTGPRNFDIVFTEPVKAGEGKVSIKQGNSVIGNRAEANGTNTVSVEAFTNFVEDKTYELVISEFQDFAKYQNVVKTHEFTYVKDATPPTAKVVKAEQNYVVIEFNKPVKGLEAAKFYHTFTAWDSIGIYKSTDFTDTNKVGSTEYVNTVYVRFYEIDNTDSRPLQPGDVNVGILGDKIVDRWSNKLGDVVLPVTIKADTTVLAVEDIVVKTEAQLEVKFTKNVKEFTSSNVEVLDKDGKAVAGLIVTVDGTTVKDKNKALVNFNTKQSGKMLTVVIKNVEEAGLAGTKITSDSRVIEITDKSAPEIAEVYYKIADKKVVDGVDTYETKYLVVRFNEAVDAETALVATNYSLVKGTEVTILSEGPSWDGDSTRVMVPLTNKQARLMMDNGPIKTNFKLQVINVKDVAGNTITPVINSIDTNLSEDTVVDVKSVSATKKDTVKIKFNDKLTGISQSTFVLSNGSEEVKDNNLSITQSEENGVTVVEVKANKAIFSTNASDVNVTLKLAGLKDSFGNDVKDLKSFAVVDGSYTFDDAEINDAIAPEVFKYPESDTNKGKYQIERVSGTTSGAIVVKYSEKINENTVSALTYSVENATVDTVVVDGANNTVTINFTAKSGYVVPDAPRVTQLVKILDMDGNSLLLEGAIQSIDKR